jgi:mRNA interferase RelE/StbE
LIADYIDHLKESADPRAYGKPLVADLKGLWRYRVGKYRIICDILQRKLVIEVVKIGKRDKVYD